MIARLNDLERPQSSTDGRWMADGSEMASAIKFRDKAGTLGASRLRPDEVAKAVREELLARSATVA